MSQLFDHEKHFVTSFNQLWPSNPPNSQDNPYQFASTSPSDNQPKQLPKLLKLTHSSRVTQPRQLSLISMAGTTKLNRHVLE